MAGPIPWWEPKLGDNERRALLDVFDSGFINDGPNARKLEQRVAGIAGTAHGIATPNCTSALALSVMAAGIGHGDRVIVPDVTFIATANAVRLAGAEVDLVDVDADTYTIDPQRAADAVGPNTKAIIAVEFNGRAPDYAALNDICERNGLVLITDSAQALGSRFQGQGMGSFGKAGCFSFSGHKMFFGGQGGVAVTNDDDMAARLRDLRDHAKRDGGKFGDMTHPHLGFNFKLPDLLAAVVMPQLDELDQRMDHARQRDGWYRDRLGNHPDITFPTTGPDEVCLWSDIRSPHRDAITHALDDQKIGFRRFWLPLHRQAPYTAPDGAFPNALASWQEGVWLPSALSLTEDQANRVTEAVLTVCR